MVLHILVLYGVLLTSLAWSPIGFLSRQT